MAAFPVHAAQVELNQIVTLQMRKVKLADVFKKLSNLSGYEFFYDESVVQKYNTIDIDLDNVSFDQALEQIRKQTSLQLSKVNNTIVVSLARQVLASSGKVQASRHRVTGRVTDANNEPLIGVSIVIQGNSGGTITDIDGRYTLEEVDADATLVFSYIGYVSQKIVVGNQQTLNVQMKEDNQTLEEVVVIGYGVQKKVNVTGAVSMVKAEAIENRPITNVTTGLQGLLPGVSIVSSSGQPGAVPSINIRGTGTINSSTAPLILIDGVAGGDINLLNPSDIESVSVLKDAASSAIYGARAANGVILVTTKKGEKKERVVFQYNGYAGFQTPTALPELVNGREYMELSNEAMSAAGFSKPYTQEAFDKYDSGLYPNEYSNTDWIDEIYKSRAFQTGHNVSARGGSEKTGFFMSYGFQYPFCQV
jgi:TonB-linked SusC/RagA family outer membrane protein